MKILLTNAFLASPTGSEVYIRDLAIRLKKDGNEVFVYTMQIGEFAASLKNHGIPVSTTVRDFPKPDIIHAQHFEVSKNALEAFPDVPALFFLHNRTHPIEQPLIHPSIKKYISVDYNCKDRLLENGIPEERIGVIYNWADTDKFVQKAAVREKPVSALVFSNYGGMNDHFRMIAEGCFHEGIKISGLGMCYGNATQNPEKELFKHDIVFAKAKAAMEALSVGCAVILCDFMGLGYLVEADNYEHSRRFNFGMKTLTRPITAFGIRSEIQKYNAEKVKRVSDIARADLHFDNSYKQILQEYKNCL